MRTIGMTLSRFQKLFGVGPIASLIGAAILGFLWLLDKALGHIQILAQPRPVRMTGSFLIGIWICWHIWCMHAIRRWWRHNELCTTGPHRIVRHPIYAGGILLGALGISLLFNSWIVLLQPVFFYGIVSVLVRKEENMMQAVFGEEYQRYAARTGRLFPRFSK